MPKKEICINTGVEVSIEKVFNFSTPEQVYDQLVKITEESIKPFIKKFGEPSRLLFKTRKYANDTTIHVHFMRTETDEEYEERRIRMRQARKIRKIEDKCMGVVVEVVDRKKLKKKITKQVQGAMAHEKRNIS
jgi:hypothetical protein